MWEQQGWVPALSEEGGTPCLLWSNVEFGLCWAFCGCLTFLHSVAMLSCFRGEQIERKKYMEAKLPAGWVLESLKIPLLTTTPQNIHLEVFFPLRKRLQLFGRARSFDWPLYCCLPRWFLTNPVLCRVVWESAELPSATHLIWNVFMFRERARSLGAPPTVPLSTFQGRCDPAVSGALCHRFLLLSHRLKPYWFGGAGERGGEGGEI